MGLPEKLLEKLACPKCRQALDYIEAENRLVCESCRVGFRITDDIPVLQIDEAEKLE
jgi:uncharacterized protein YbaR (Trm112 family)